MQVLGTARNALLVLVSVYLYDEIVTGLQLFGYLLSLVFFGTYNYYQMAVKR